MAILSGSVSMTRYRIIDDVPPEAFSEAHTKLKSKAFPANEQEVSHYGWCNFDDLLDTEWRLSPPEKGEWLCFGLRYDKRKVPAAALKKELREVINAEISEGRRITKGRRQELKEIVTLRLLKQAIPVPTMAQVTWNMQTNAVYITTISTKFLELFEDFFVETFGLHLERTTPSVAARTEAPDKVEAYESLMTHESIGFVQPKQYAEDFDDALGREFLTWLWYRSEQKVPADPSIEAIETSIEISDRITVTGGDVASRFKTTVTGKCDDRLQEARYGLLYGKLVSKMLVFLDHGDNSFQVVLTHDGTLCSMKTPKVGKIQADDDPDAAFFVKMSYIDECCSLIDMMFKEYIELRFSGAWENVSDQVAAWINKEKIGSLEISWKSD